MIRAITRWRAGTSPRRSRWRSRAPTGGGPPRRHYLSNITAVSRALPGTWTSREISTAVAWATSRGMIPDSARRSRRCRGREASLFRVGGDRRRQGTASAARRCGAVSEELLGEGGVLNVAASILNNLGLLLKSDGRLHAARLPASAPSPSAPSRSARTRPPSRCACVTSAPSYCSSGT